MEMNDIRVDIPLEHFDELRERSKELDILKKKISELVLLNKIQKEEPVNSKDEEIEDEEYIFTVDSEKMESLVKELIKDFGWIGKPEYEWIWDTDEINQMDFVFKKDVIVDDLNLKR